MTPVLLFTALAAASGIVANSKRAANADTIEFANVGFPGLYFDVSKFLDVDSDSCSCTLSDDSTLFSGTNAPLDEELSVHFRGPLSLLSFGAYVSNDSDAGTWLRLSYYNAANQTAENVTFITHAGDNSPCLGEALTFASANGTGKASAATILEADNLIESNEEFIIFSNLLCPDSGASNACGYYRDDNVAYHGFYGTTKMFLFEFQMPEATEDSDSNYNMPAIWFLNAKIPRASQYPTSYSCSCWNSGCGEIDIFEVMNTSTTDMLFSTIHDFQGTGLIDYGLQADAYFTRDTSGTMKGGVVFGSNGTISIFMLDDMTIPESVAASTVNGWFSTTDEETMTLESIAAASTTTKASGGLAVASGWIATLASLVFLALMYF